MGPRDCSRGNKIRVDAINPGVAIASMGPRDCSRGNATAQAGSAIRSARFNGAARLLARKCSPSITASFPSFSFNGAARLLARKSGQHSRIRTARSTASMGPRDCSRGNSVDFRSTSSCSRSASMGPRDCSRGNSSSGVGRRVTGRSLQWGRAIARAEMFSNRRFPAMLALLQWGRAIARAEIC